MMYLTLVGPKFTRPVMEVLFFHYYCSKTHFDKTCRTAGPLKSCSPVVKNDLNEKLCHQSYEKAECNFQTTARLGLDLLEVGHPELDDV